MEIEYLKDLQVGIFEQGSLYYIFKRRRRLGKGNGGTKPNETPRVKMTQTASITGAQLRSGELLL